MAVVSEGTFYQGKIAPSYVSSSGYYGYVPPCPIADYENVVVAHQHEVGCVGEANDQTNGLSWSFSVPRAMQHQQQQAYHQQQQDNNQRELLCFNGSAMETDNDEYVRVSSRCENNRCVIPEAEGLSLDASGDGYENVYRVTQQYGHIGARTRGNRKRNSPGDPAYLFAGHPNNLTKKPRQDGGNCNVRDGTGRSGKCGSAAMHYQSRSLNSIGDFCRLNGGGLDAFKSSNSCRQAAGNYDSIGHSNLERPCNLTNNGHDNLLESYLDYEEMLMETHGCSSYHYHRNLDIDVPEAEL